MDLIYPELIHFILLGAVLFPLGSLTTTQYLVVILSNSLYSVRLYITLLSHPSK